MMDQTILQPLDLLILRGNWYNPMLYVIMQRTSSRWTHAVTYRGKGQVYDAGLKGVCYNSVDHYNGRGVAVLRYNNKLSLEEKIEMLKWLDRMAQDSVPYDFKALLGFITGLKALDDENAWYCSEIPYWMYHEFRHPLFNGEKTFIYPADLYKCNDFNIIYEGVV